MGRAARIHLQTAQPRCYRPPPRADKQIRETFCAGLYRISTGREVPPGTCSLQQTQPSQEQPPQSLVFPFLGLTIQTQCVFIIRIRFASRSASLDSKASPLSLYLTFTRFQSLVFPKDGTWIQTSLDGHQLLLSFGADVAFHAHGQLCLC